jgi:hypothetical protein
MNLTYVPTWLTMDDRDAEGWPKFVTAEQRKWLVAKVKEFIERRGPVTLQVLVWWIFREEGSPRWAVFDAQYAAVHRALLEAGCEQVWSKS